MFPWLLRPMKNAGSIVQGSHQGWKTHDFDFNFDSSNTKKLDYDRVNAVTRKSHI